MAFPQWRPGMILTSDRMNARNLYTVIQASDQVLTSETETYCDIEYELEANAVYEYTMLISYSAVRSGSGGAALGWKWDVPTGARVERFTSSYVQNPDSGVSSGALIIQRRPATTTLVQAGGSDTSSPPSNYHSAYDRGVVLTYTTPGMLRLQVSKFSSGSNPILRGGNQTRLLIRRIK